jgi:dihydroorotase
MLKYRARSLNQCHVYPTGALTVGLQGARLTEMAELTEAGCIAFSHANAPLTDTLVLFRALDYAATFNFAVWLHPRDPYLSKGGVAHDGEVATRLGLPAIPTCAETIAISTALQLVCYSGARVHFCRLSSLEGIRMVGDAKRKGLPVTCDVGIHHLHLSDRDLGYFDSNCHLIPPLRALRDRDGLRLALSDGTVDAACSDHTPVDEDAKQLPFAQAEPGATGVELLLPLTLKWGREMKLGLSAALAKITLDPARIMGLDAGYLAPDHAADICIFDADELWRVEPRALLSQGKNTPFAGLEMQGKVRYTLVDGLVVFEDVRHGALLHHA